MNAAEAASKLADRCKDLCRDLFPNGGVVHGEYRVGNVNGDKGQSLGICLTGTKRGVWFDFESDERGDALDLVKAVKRLGTVAAIEWSCHWLGEPVSDHNGSATLLINGVPLSVIPATNVAVERRDNSESNDNIERAKEVWRYCRPADVIVKTYFAARGLSIVAPPTIRETPCLRHWPTKRDYPAIVSAVQAPSGAIVGVHRTYLAPSLKTKAPVKQARMMLGPLAGNVVRLGPATEKLVLAEGLENGLSVFQSCPNRTVWCCLSVFNLAPQIPDQVKEVIMCLDGDAPDSKAFQVSERRVQELMSRGLVVHVFRAPPGLDHNDLLRLPGSKSTTTSPKGAMYG